MYSTAFSFVTLKHRRAPFTFFFGITKSPQSRLREPKPHQTSSLRPPSHGALSPSVLSPSALAAHYPDESETAFTPGDEFTVAEQFQGRHNYFSDENDNSVDWDVYKHGVHTAHYEIHPHQWVRWKVWPTKATISQKLIASD